MSEPCKHGHVDGVMHKPCPQCTADLRFENEMLLCRQIDGLKERIAELEAERTALVGAHRDLVKAYFDDLDSDAFDLLMRGLRALIDKEPAPSPPPADDGSQAADGVGS